MSQKRAKNKKERIELEKKQLKESDQTISTQKNITTKTQSYPVIQTKRVIPAKPKASVYRFFKEEKYAREFLQGSSIRLGTLGEFRSYECTEQGDPEEAEETYHSGSFHGYGSDPIVRERARRLGIDIKKGHPESQVIISINNSASRTRLQDAYVLCTTTYYSEEMKEVFGKYCVEITHPEKFFNTINIKIRTEKAIKESIYGLVLYRDQSYTGIEQPPGIIGFVKRPSYASQRECRLIFLPQNSNSIKPIFLECPEVEDICRLV